MIEAMRITLGDLIFNALASGPKGGEPVLLLHGWPEFADCWRPIMESLAEAGCRAIAVDQRGYSPGARPPDVADYAIDRLVADALGFADQHGWATFHLVAHDWGGVVAWTLAGAHPDRLRTLTVLATPHPVALSTEAAMDKAQYHRLDYIRFFREPGGTAEAALLANGAARLRAAYGGNIPPALVDANAERLSRPGALTAALNWYRAVAEDLAVPAGRITTPTLYVWGDQDAALGAGAARRTADYVDARYRFHILAGKSHWLPEQAADQIAPLLLDHLAAGDRSTGVTMTSSSIRRVTVAGAGVLGAQIAFQAAVHGFDVSLYDINDGALEAGRRRLKALQADYDDNGVASPQQTAAALARTTLTTSLSDSLADADLLIEAIPERLEIKQAFYTQLKAVAPVKTIFASNSSTMVPSQLAPYSGRPERFLHLHFATPVWQHNIAEIMAHPHSDPAAFGALIAFSRQMGMVPIPLKKEQPGYVLNALLVPFLLAALQLFVDGAAEYQLIDKTWMIAKDAKSGPFGSIDQIGIVTAYNIARNIAEQNRGSDAVRVAAYLKEHFIDTGKLGVDVGEGFYTYPNPAYLAPGFLT